MNHGSEKITHDIIERFLRSRHPAIKITHILLGVIAFGAIMGMAMIAPNVFQAFRRVQKKRHYSSRRLQQSLSALRYSGYVRCHTQRGTRNSMFTLTKKGKSRLLDRAFEVIQLKRLRKWDGVWRFVLFDIPHEKRATRHALRRKLQYLGFVQYQKSVWITPYPCTEEIDFLRDFYRVRPYVKLLSVKQLGDDKEKFEKHFYL